MKDGQQGKSEEFVKKNQKKKKSKFDDPRRDCPDDGKFTSRNLNTEGR